MYPLDFLKHLDLLYLNNDVAHWPFKVWTNKLYIGYIEFHFGLESNWQVCSVRLELYLMHHWYYIMHAGKNMTSNSSRKLLYQFVHKEKGLYMFVQWIVLCRKLWYYNKKLWLTETYQIALLKFCSFLYTLFYSLVELAFLSNHLLLMLLTLRLCILKYGIDNMWRHRMCKRKKHIKHIYFLM